MQEQIAKFMAQHGYDTFEVKAALIDMDGVLYDSMPYHADAWMEMAQKHGIKAQRNEFFGFEGMTGAATINLLFNRQFGRNATLAEIETLYKEKTDNFRLRGKAPLMPGASRMIATLAEVDINRVLVTGSGQHSLIDRINIDYPCAFPAGNYITSADVCHGKPDPEPYLKGMKKAGVKPNQAIVIENAPCGVLAGARSGAFTIAVATGPIPHDQLWQAGAALVFDSMQAFADALPKVVNLLNTYHA